MSPTGLMYWEIHISPVNGNPCPACRYLISGNELAADRLWCEPKDGGCGHFHRGSCPEIQDSPKAGGDEAA